ncbi:hypothetical protein EHW66_15370 [Erwinia psidii]|uniref:hypothetical protein n=1 Tax=Erwinia psidii TaxID=69224 RepID=UPI00226AFFD9|nr:hypothetical protein [Erwinia psidii]MCX8966314.1 hypothetical protein [Erwinia psidii]
MSALSTVLTPRFTSFNQRVKAVIQQLVGTSRVHRRSDWFINGTGNLAVRADIVPTADGFHGWLTFREGWYEGSYVYSRRLIAFPGGKIRSQKAWRLACQQAEHLAHLRYRFR